MDPLATKWNPLIMIREIKRREKIKNDVEGVKNNLDSIRDNLKLLKKKNLVKNKPPCRSSKLVLTPGNPKNYTEKEYKSDFYSKLKGSTFTKSEIDELYKSTLDQLNPVFKSATKKDKISPESELSDSESSRSESSESELSKPELEDDEIFFEHLSVSSDSESE